MSPSNNESDSVSISEWDSMDVYELLNCFDIHPEHASYIVRAYSHTFGRAIVEIQATCDNMPSHTHSPRQSTTGDKIYLCGQRMWYHFLNVFGSVITRLKINYNDFNETQCYELHQIIGQTCAINLVEIKFNGIKSRIPIDDLVNYHFPYVGRVEIVDSKLSDRLPLFSTLFPNVRIVKVINVNMESFDAYFKNLDRFVIIKDDINGVKHEINVICKA